MNSKIMMLSILLVCAVCAVESSIGKPLHITHLNCSTACPPGGRTICAISKSGDYGSFENDCFFSRYNNCVHIKENKDSEYFSKYFIITKRRNLRELSAVRYH